jgi:membrane associated rhomboid family serine protease
LSSEKQKFYRSLLYPLLFIIFLWFIQIASQLFKLDLVFLGVLPRTIHGLIGIVTAPLIHAGYSHLLSNSIPLFILAASILYFYPNAALKVFVITYFVTEILVWLFARQSFHIGISGQVYGFLGFLFFSGVFRKDNRSIGLALLVTFLYGGLVWGVLPGMKGISWESHLFGGLVGIACAFIFRKSDPYLKYDWEAEEDSDNNKKPEISYDKDDNDFLQ